MKNQQLTHKFATADNELGGLLIGNRIPKDYFITKGTGQSDITIHAGSYHLALKSANIERCNIMTYSSILPDIATKIAHPENLRHGSVMETIMSVCHANKGERATAGIIYGWLYDKNTRKKHGGLVCEHYGNQEVEVINNLLHDSLNELYYNGFSDDFDLADIEINTESFIPTKTYGTALVALCFVNYVFPLANSNN